MNILCEWNKGMMFETRSDVPVDTNSQDEQIYILGYLKELMGYSGYYSYYRNMQLTIASYMET